jgi:hypothetical protein
MTTAVDSYGPLCDPKQGSVGSRRNGRLFRLIRRQESFMRIIDSLDPFAKVGQLFPDKFKACLAAEKAKSVAKRFEA